MGFSPCPNDTFIFHGMVNGFVDTTPLTFDPIIEDVEELNRMAMESKLHITKMSFYAYLKLKGEYDILDAGAALGFGCGPLLVSGEKEKDLSSCTIAVPGEMTTANLLFNLWSEKHGEVVYTRFDKIMPGIQSGEFDAGVIIHEGRFIYQDIGLKKIVDLGEWWESQTRLPIPLGCIAIRRDRETVTYKERIEKIIKKSIDHGLANPAASREYIKKYSQELSDDVIENHISLYVNEFSRSLGKKGKETLKVLEEAATSRGLL